MKFWTVVCYFMGLVNGLIAAHGVVFLEAANAETQGYISLSLLWLVAGKVFD